MKIRSAIAATALTTAALVAGAASADAATTVDRHIDTHAPYYQTQAPTTIVNSWHGHPVIYIANQGSYGYVTCSGGIASPIYVEDVAIRDGIPLNVVKHEFTHVLECWNGDYNTGSRYSSDALERVAEAGQMLQGGTDKRTETSNTWFHARYLLTKFLITG